VSTLAVSRLFDYLIKPVDLERLIRETLLKGKGGHQEGEGLLLF